MRDLEVAIAPAPELERVARDLVEHLLQSALMFDLETKRMEKVLPNSHERQAFPLQNGSLPREQTASILD